jgi:hypothetical protein
MKYRKMTHTDQRSRTVTAHEPTITAETATTTWIGNFCLTLMRKTSLMLMSAFPHHLSFSSPSLDPQVECEGDNDDSKDSKGDKGSKHSKHNKECKASEDNEGRKSRAIPQKGQVDASLDGQC